MTPAAEGSIYVSFVCVFCVSFGLFLVSGTAEAALGGPKPLHDWITHAAAAASGGPLDVENFRTGM